MKRITSYFLHLDQYNGEDVETLSKMKGISCQIIVLDDDGNILEREQLADGPMDCKSVYKYNSENKFTEGITTKPDGEITQVEVSFYNEKGLLAEDLIFGGNMEFLNFRFIYEYDDQNNRISETLVNDDGFQRKTYYLKPAPGSNERTQLIKNEKDELTETIVETLDEHGNSTRVRHYDSANVLQKELKYYYDKQGNNTKFIIHYIFEPGELNLITHTYEYTYDENGNWIRSIHHIKPDSENCFPPSVTVREVEEW